MSKALLKDTEVEVRRLREYLDLFHDIRQIQKMIPASTQNMKFEHLGVSNQTPAMIDCDMHRYRQFTGKPRKGIRMVDFGSFRATSGLDAVIRACTHSRAEKSIKTRQEERGDGEGQGFLHQRLLKLEIEKSIKNNTGGEGLLEKIIKSRHDGEGQGLLYQRLLKLEIEKSIKTRQEERACRRKI